MSNKVPTDPSEEGPGRPGGIWSKVPGTPEKQRDVAAIIAAVVVVIAILTSL